MLGFSAFKNAGIDAGSLKGGEQLSLGIHNSLLQLANTSSFKSPAAYGAGLGAAYGAADGAFSYDGSIMGGAFHGAMLGGVGGVGLKQAANTYGKGALELGTATGISATNGLKGSFKNSWKSGYTDSEGALSGAFQTSAFSKGW